MERLPIHELKSNLQNAIKPECELDSSTLLKNFHEITMCINYLAYDIMAAILDLFIE